MTSEELKEIKKDYHFLNFLLDFKDSKIGLHHIYNTGRRQYKINEEKLNQLEKIPDNKKHFVSITIDFNTIYENKNIQFKENIIYDSKKEYFKEVMEKLLKLKNIKYSLTLIDSNLKNIPKYILEIPNLIELILAETKSFLGIFKYKSNKIYKELPDNFLSEDNWICGKSIEEIFKLMNDPYLE